MKQSNMKKIIELAEKYLAHDMDDRNTWSNSWMRENDTMLCELLDTITHRRKLEQTPITEDWLKEHGWEVNHHEGDDHNWDFYNSFDGRYAHIYLHALCKPQFWQVNYNGNTILLLHLSTIADLTDALELCGITMKD